MNSFKRQKLELYILSLFLLFLILFITKVPYNFEKSSAFIGFSKLFNEHLILVICIVCMGCGIVFYFRFKYSFGEGTTLHPMEVTRIQNINYESVTFLATYIVPMACIDLDKDRSCLMLVTILVLIGWIYIKTNLFYTNPTLAIWGYYIYKVSIENSNTVKSDIIVIAHRKLKVADTIRIKEIDDEIFLAK